MRGRWRKLRAARFGLKRGTDSPLTGLSTSTAGFVKDFSHHAQPLFDLTRKEQKWKCDSPEASAFRKLKELVTSAPILITPADDQPFRIEADSSDFATGAVLSQLSTEDGKWHPVVFL
jgi:hypothetical protein